MNNSINNKEKKTVAASFYIVTAAHTLCLASILVIACFCVEAFQSFQRSCNSYLKMFYLSFQNSRKLRFHHFLRPRLCLSPFD